MVGYGTYAVETVGRVVRIEADYVSEEVSEGIEYQVSAVGMAVSAFGHPFAELGAVAVCLRFPIDLLYDFVN